MKKQKPRAKLSVLGWSIRLLILAIFCIALVIAAGRLMEWNEERQRLADAEKKKQELQEAIDTQPPGEGQP